MVPQWTPPFLYKMAVFEHVEKLLLSHLLREAHSRFLKTCAYEAAFKESDMMNIGEENLTFKEQQLLSEVRSDCQKHTDLIIDNGYTGAIKEENLDAIVRSLHERIHAWFG